MMSHAKKKIILQCGEKGESRLTIDMKVALQSKVIMELIKPSLLVDLEEIVVVLPDIKLSTMLKVVTYLTRHAKESEKVFDYSRHAVHEGLEAFDDKEHQGFEVLDGKKHEGLEAFDGHKHEGLEAFDGEELEDIEAFDAKFVDVDPVSLFLISHVWFLVPSLMTLTLFSLHMIRCLVLGNKFLTSYY